MNIFLVILLFYAVNAEDLRDSNECDSPSNNDCHDNATCTTTEGSYDCTCDDGFNGNGTVCYVLKVGDKVRIISDVEQLKKSFEGIGMDYVEVMKDMAGKVFEIQSMFTNHLNHEFVALPKLDGDGTWYFPKTVVDLYIDACTSNPCHTNATCSITEGSYECVCQEKFAGDGYICVRSDFLKAMADFYQDDLSGVRSSDVEGTRLESGDFIFHWDDGPNRKMVRTNNTGDFIQSGFYGGSKVGDNWKNFGSWMNGGYSIKNFRGYQYTGRDVIEYGTYQIPTGVVGKFNMSLLPIPDGVFGDFFFAQATGGPFGSVTLVNEGETLESQSSVGPYLYFVPGRDGKPLSLNWWHAGSAFNNSPIFEDNFKSGTETIDYTSKRECRHVSLADMLLSEIPTILLTHYVKYTKSPEYMDYTVTWLTNVTKDGFNFCVHEGIFFSGAHQVKVTYFVFGDVARKDAISELGVKNFTDSSSTESELCNVVPFNSTYSSPPVVFVSASIDDEGEVAVWIKSTCRSDMEVCMQRSGRLGNNLANTALHYLVMGSKEQDNCTFAETPHNLECYPSETDPNGYEFACIQNCTDRMTKSCKPATPVCGTDFGTYSSECEMYRVGCEIYGQDNFTGLAVASSDGSCEGHQLQVGSKQLNHVSGRGFTYCNYIPLNASAFHGFSDVMVLHSVHWGQTMTSLDPTNIHGSSTSWTANVTADGFNACIRAVPGDVTISSPPWLDYFAFQVNLRFQTNDMLDGGMIDVGDFTSGSTCTTGYEMDPTKTRFVLSLHHQEVDQYDDAAAVWVEISGNQSKACVVESRQMSGLHSNVAAVWLLATYADESTTTQSTPFEDGQYCLEKSYNVSQSLHYQFNTVVKSVSPADFQKKYSKNAYTAWTENSGESTVRVCYEDIYGDGLDVSSRLTSLRLGDTG